MAKKIRNEEGALFCGLKYSLAAGVTLFWLLPYRKMTHHQAELRCSVSD